MTAGGARAASGTDPASGGTAGRCVLTGTVRVGLPPAEAFRLFTPVGERDWVDGWDPRFPVPAGDDTAPGTVFETTDHGRTTTWVVTGREPGRAVAYARVTPGDRAGTVSVVLEGADGGDGGGTAATVTYELTALTEAAREDLRAFAAGYPAFLRSWEEAIADALGRRAPSAVPPASLRLR
ncbi:hypothetical protein [Actinoallomurus soli]|uniref:hypothetical protein n=1 Tax=Actinoallomurus soli TaxID=2952535 RepID=UPI0020933258|nr:hypothetical protein [Actinoallomurus soli]MCO5974536.1 hypothetical protein [Actinoallomurus soli]